MSFPLPGENVASVLRAALVASVPLALPFVLPLAALSAQEPGFELVPVATGVYAAIRTETSSNVVIGNSLIVVNDADVVVVDAGGTPAAARALIAGIRRLTPKPVSHVVSTHWHDDHVMGNQAFREAWPSVEFVAHPATREAMTTTAVANREQFVKGLPGILDFVRGQVAAGQGLDGEAADSAELGSLRADVALGEAYLAQVPSFRVTLATIPVERRMRLSRGGRIIDIRWFGPANTDGDLVVHLPNEGIVATGDLVVLPTPFFFRSHIAGWLGALDSLRALRPGVIVPGHGPVLRGTGRLDDLSRALAAVRDQTRALAARGLTWEQGRDSVNLEPHRHAFAGADRVRNAAWRNYFAGPAVRAGFEDAASR